MLSLHGLTSLATSASFATQASLAIGSPSPDGPDLTRYIAVCALLLAAIGGLAFGFRRLVGGALKAKAAQRSLQVLDVLPLGGKHKLAVVRCYDRAFVLGLGEKELSLVAELDPVYADAAPRAPAMEKGFGSMLANALPRGPRRGRAREENAEEMQNGGVLG